MKYFSSPLTKFAALFPLALGSAQAETKTLSGASAGWSTAANWTPGGTLPVAADNVVISSTVASDVRGSQLLQTGAPNGTATIQDLAFNSTAAINLVNGSTGSNTTLTLSGGRGAGVPLIATTGDFPYGIISPNTSARTFTLNLGASGDVDVSANTLTISGILAGAQSLNKTGAGTLVLSGPNVFSGGLTLTGGILRAVTNPAALGAGTLT